MSKRFIGIMTGTSMDGIDVALIRIDEPFALTLEAQDSYLFSPDEREALLALIPSGAREPAELVATEVALGERYAESITTFLEDNVIDPTTVTAIGLHGLTYFHLPDGATALGRRVAGTMQIGDPFVVAARTGIPVIHDFRRADMALGGQGAPLAPYLDRLLFSHPDERRILLNLGGIANLTLLDPGRDRLLAFDSGPANMIIDLLMAHHPDCAAGYDPDGHYAARGRVLHALLDRLLTHPYFQRQPPKSTGRELFGASFARNFLDLSNSEPIDDLVATATELTIRTVAQSVRDVLAGRFRETDQLIVSGGGALNKTMMAGLRNALPAMTVATTADHGLPVECKEAVLMAALAWAHLERRPGNVPEITGASAPTVLGAFVPAHQ